ncbi:hypothetical protein V7S43_018181 [Phytophthora oleae]|uniref:Big-1 domain-containing protein n=1 Tax=Phytophthora oleae TaxID=2107226 RepID=A0ABD3ERC1_9STRA
MRYRRSLRQGKRACREYPDLRHGAVGTVADVNSDDNWATAGTDVAGKGGVSADVGGGVGGTNPWLDGDADVDTDTNVDTDSGDDIAGGAGADGTGNGDGGVDTGVSSNVATTGGVSTSVGAGKNTGVSAVAVTPFPSTGGGASVTASVTDSNGKTQTVSKTSDGQFVSANVDSKSGTASTGATTWCRSLDAIPFYRPGRVRNCDCSRLKRSHAVDFEDERRSNYDNRRGSDHPSAVGSRGRCKGHQYDGVDPLKGPECYAELSSRSVSTLNVIVVFA